jgi:hypothetical protein
MHSSAKAVSDSDTVDLVATDEHSGYRFPEKSISRTKQ